MSNFHVLVIHFPIVFAIMYGLIETISFFKKERSGFLHQAGGWTTLFGLASTLVAQQTGSMIRRAVQWSAQQKQLIRTHSNLSNLLVWIFCIALAGYLIDWTLANQDMLRRYFANKPALSKILEIKISLLAKVQPFLSSRALRFALGVSAVIIVSIVGALGGAVAFGCKVDPLASYLCTFF